MPSLEPASRRAATLLASTALLLAGFAPRPLAAAERPATVDELLEEARKQLDSRRFGKAAEMARQVVAAIARLIKVQGTVILEAVVDERGEVRCIRVLTPLALGLTQAAVDAVRTWKFKPARLHDQPVKVSYTLTTSFAIR